MFNGGKLLNIVPWLVILSLAVVLTISLLDFAGVFDNESGQGLFRGEIPLIKEITPTVSAQWAISSGILLSLGALGFFGVKLAGVLKDKSASRRRRR